MYRFININIFFHKQYFGKINTNIKSGRILRKKQPQEFKIYLKFNFKCRFRAKATNTISFALPKSHKFQQYLLANKYATLKKIESAWNIFYKNFLPAACRFEKFTYQTMHTVLLNFSTLKQLNAAKRSLIKLKLMSIHKRK